MKKQLLAALAAMAVMAGAFAQNFPAYLKMKGTVITGCDKDEVPDNLVIPEGVTEIDSRAFENCAYLESVVIPSSVTKIGMYVFKNCTSLESVTLSDGATVVGGFADCALLANVTLPASVKVINNDAFSGCKALANITIPEGVEKIGSKAFYESELKTVAIPASVKEIGDSAFMDCASLESATLAEGVEKIGDSAFRGTGLKTITIPKSVKSLGNFVFSGCNSLESVTLSRGITELKDGTFSRCKALRSVAIPRSVTSIDGYAFSGCVSLVVQFDGKIAQWEATTYKKNYFSGVNCTDGSVGIVEIPPYLYLEGTSVIGCDKDKLPSNVVIPEGVTSIGYEAFHAPSLKSVSVPKSVTYIEGYAFDSNDNLVVQYAGTKEQWTAIKKEYDVSTFAVRCSDGDFAKQDWSYK